MSHPWLKIEMLVRGMELHLPITVQTQLLHQEHGTIIFYDTPSSTSQITYKVGVKQGMDNWFLNRTVSDTDQLILKERHIFYQRDGDSWTMAVYRRTTK